MRKMEWSVIITATQLCQEKLPKASPPSSLKVCDMLQAKFSRFPNPKWFPTPKKVRWFLISTGLKLERKLMNFVLLLLLWVTNKVLVCWNTYSVAHLKEENFNLDPQNGITPAFALYLKIQNNQHAEWHAWLWTSVVWLQKHFPCLCSTDIYDSKVRQPLFSSFRAINDI